MVGVYIPPAGSISRSARVGTIFYGISETVMRLQLAHLVPAEHVLITGDFNVHLGTL